MNDTQTTIAAASDAACSRLVDAHQHPVNWLFRVACFLAAIPTGGVWLVGCWLNPSGGPLGIERQLGTARCGFYAKYGIPCPTCGWTTAVSHLYHGQIFQAFFHPPGRRDFWDAYADRFRNFTRRVADWPLDGTKTAMDSRQSVSIAWVVCVDIGGILGI